MNRESKLNPTQLTFFKKLKDLHESLDSAFVEDFNRSVPFGDIFIDRWERAKKLGFGDSTNIYDSSLVIGDVIVGVKCWIGPYTILDGSGGLKIGDYCTISSGVHIYTHDNVKSTLSSGQLPIEKSPVQILNNCYIGPNCIISKGVTIEEFTIVAANSFVNKSFEKASIIAGNPAKQIGKVIFEKNENITFKYY